jgi:Fasciclin domain
MRLRSALTHSHAGNKAFADVSTTLRGASPAAARAVLSHHVTPGLVVLPRPRGAPASLQSGLAGQSLNMSVRPTRINTPWDKNPVPVEAAVVTSAGGKTANVRIYDIYAGKSVLHGVDSVLLPAAPGAGSGSTKPAATTGMPGTRGRRLAGHQSWVGTDEPSMSQAESSVPGFYQDGAGEGGGRSDGAGEAHGKGRRRLSQDWVGTDEPSFNDAEMGYYQGYPSMCAKSER